MSLMPECPHGDPINYDRNGFSFCSKCKRRQQEKVVTGIIAFLLWAEYPLEKLAMEKYKPGHFYTFWAPILNTDNNEGKGGTYFTDLYESMSDAKRGSKGMGVMGTDAPVNQVTVIYTYTGNFLRFSGSADDLTLHLKSPTVSVRQKVWEKLTPEERTAVGLNPDSFDE